jgi:hypothetical protein
MKKSLFWKGMVLGVAWAIVFSALNDASGEEEIRLQGYLMSFKLDEKKIFVNERTFFVDEKTVVKNAEGSPVTLDQLKPNSWVYMKGKREGFRKRPVIREIYLLPKYISYKEKSRYPFMQESDGNP